MPSNSLALRSSRYGPGDRDDLGVLSEEAEIRRSGGVTAAVTEKCVCVVNGDVLLLL